MCGPKDINIHNWATTTSKHYGISLKEFIKQVMCECGLEPNCPCTGDCFGCNKTTTTTEAPKQVQRQEIAQPAAKEIQLLIGVMEQMNNTFLEEIAKLKAEVETLKKPKKRTYKKRTPKKDK